MLTHRILLWADWSVLDSRGDSSSLKCYQNCCTEMLFWSAGGYLHLSCRTLRSFALSKSSLNAAWNLKTWMFKWYTYILIGMRHFVITTTCMQTWYYQISFPPMKMDETLEYCSFQSRSSALFVLCANFRYFEEAYEEHIVPYLDNVQESPSPNFPSRCTRVPSLFQYLHQLLYNKHQAVGTDCRSEKYHILEMKSVVCLHTIQLQNSWGT